MPGINQSSRFELNLFNVNFLWPTDRSRCSFVALFLPLCAWLYLRPGVRCGLSQSVSCNMLNEVFTEFSCFRSSKNKNKNVLGNISRLGHSLAILFSHAIKTLLQVWKYIFGDKIGCETVSLHIFFLFGKERNDDLKLDSTLISGSR